MCSNPRLHIPGYIKIYFLRLAAKTVLLVSNTIQYMTSKMADAAISCCFVLNADMTFKGRSISAGM